MHTLTESGAPPYPLKEQECACFWSYKTFPFFLSICYGPYLFIFYIALLNVIWWTQKSDNHLICIFSQILAFTEKASCGLMFACNFELFVTRLLCLMWQFIRFLRRTEGVEAARKYFLDARKSPNCTYHVFVAYAMMAFCLDKDPKVTMSQFCFMISWRWYYILYKMNGKMKGQVFMLYWYLLLNKKWLNLLNWISIGTDRGR